MNAINDALRPFGAKVFAQPFTPERILAALGKVPARWPVAGPAKPTAPTGPLPTTTASSAGTKPAGLLARMLGRR